MIKVFLFDGQVLNFPNEQPDNWIRGNLREGATLTFEADGFKYYIPSINVKYITQECK